MNPVCHFGESCYRFQKNHFSTYRHPHLDTLLDLCDDDIFIPSDYQIKTSRETLMSQLNIVKRQRISNSLSLPPSVSATSSLQKAPELNQAQRSSEASSKMEKAAMKRGLNDYMSYVRKRCKGDVLEKLENSEPYRIFLSSIAAESRTHDEMLTLSFPELLSEKLGVLESSLQINFQVEIGWLLAQYAVNNEKPTPITLLYGVEDSILSESSDTGKIPNVTATFIKPSAFGSHHTKMMILSYQDQSIRVIITTGNLIEMDWENTTQGIWVSPRLPLIKGLNSGNDICDSETHFKKDLLTYLEAYNLDVMKAWIEKVKSADFSEVKVFFVASFPGNHNKNSTVTWGLNRMAKLLSKYAIVPNENAKDWPLIYQASSIGSLGINPHAWLLGEFTRTMQSSINSCSFQPSVKLVYPCFEDVASSHDGIAAGGCLPYSQATHNKQTWLNNYLCKWRSDARFRTKAMPHIKSYCRLSPCKKYLSWLLLTSANLSKAAWGKENKARTNSRILNYEVGVLLIPSFLLSKHRIPLTNENLTEDGPQFTLPYNLPLISYTKDDVPWVQDVLQGF